MPARPSIGIVPVTRTLPENKQVDGVQAATKMVEQAGLSGEKCLMIYIQSLCLRESVFILAGIVQARELPKGRAATLFNQF